jgi:hypothetical protein
MKECGDHFCETLSAHSHRITFHYDAKRRTCEFILQEQGQRIRVVSDSRYLTTIFGIDPILVIENNKNHIIRCYLYEFPCKSNQEPSLDIIRTIMVYSDIGEYVHTGDVMTPYLARFPVPNVAHGEQFQWLANMPQYVRVTSNSIDTINIRLHDVFGRPLPFAKDIHSTVSCILHFRRQNT